MDHSRELIAAKFVRWFVLLGPFGVLLTPSVFPKPFRSYYFLLPLFPFFLQRISPSTLRIFGVFSFFFLYCLVSAFVSHALGVQREEDQIFRWGLFCFHFCFALGASSAVSSTEKVYSLLFLYLRSFFVVLLIGYVEYIGYYCGFFSFAFLERFSVLTQVAYGFLRFSPGSYPNEFGIMSSFVLAILLLLYPHVHRSSFYPFLIPLSFGALILATTRAAYLSFVMSFFYLCLVFPKKSIYLFGLSFFSIFLALQYFGFPISSLLFSSFLQRIDEGSLGERYFAWIDAWRLFQDHYFWGVGFGAFPQLHNVYLSLCFELGVAGCLVLVGTVLFAYLQRGSSHPDPILRKIKHIGLIHVFWFAASNHNLHHHLTWLVFFLVFFMRRNVSTEGLQGASYRQAPCSQRLLQVSRQEQ